MSVLDAIIKGFVNGALPGVICPIIQEAAGPNCKNLKIAIYMNDSLLKAYRDNARSVGLWDYEIVQRTAKRFPQARDMVTSSEVLVWLKKRGHEDIVQTLEQTPGGLIWLNRQIEDFKTDLFG